MSKSLAISLSLVISRKHCERKTKKIENERIEKRPIDIKRNRDNGREREEFKKKRGGRYWIDTGQKDWQR